jgi:hypothetical protein
MAQPLPPKKITVDLSKGGIRVSRIRRDPPPKPVKLLTREELRRRELRAMAIGIPAIALILFLAVFAVSRGPSWTPGQAVIVIRDA